MQKSEHINNHRDNQTTNNKTTKEVKATIIKQHVDHQTSKNNTTFGPMSTLGDIGPKVLFVLVVLVFSLVLIVFAWTSLVVLVSLVFPMVYDIFKCTLDSSKRLGRGCAPLFNNAFHFTRVSMYKRLPCIIDFPLQVSSPYIYEGFPLYKLFPCLRDLLL